MWNIFTRIFGSRNQRLLREYAQRVTAANGFADALAAMSDETLRAQTDKFRARLAAGESLDDLLPEAFATVREAAKRSVGWSGPDQERSQRSVRRTGRAARRLSILSVWLEETRWRSGSSITALRDG